MGAREVPGVQRAWQVRARSMGGSYLVDLAIQVESRLSASAAHKVAEGVRLEVLSKVPRVSEVLVHVDTAVHDVGCPLQTAKMHQSRSHIEVEEQEGHPCEWFFDQGSTHMAVSVVGS